MTQTHQSDLASRNDPRPRRRWHTMRYSSKHAERSKPSSGTQWHLGKTKQIIIIILTGHEGGGVVVLGAEVGNDIGVGAGVVAEPVVVVDADVAVLHELARHLPGHRRSGHRGGARVRGGVRVRAPGGGEEEREGGGEEEGAAARESRWGWDLAERARREKEAGEPADTEEHSFLY